MDALDRRITRFYDRWHRLERTLGKDDGQVLDFDLAPRADRSEEAPFESRLAALSALSALRQEATSSDAGEFLSAKLAGAEAYLRALMGERFELDAYLRATMGVGAEPASEDWIETEGAALATAFERRGVAWTPDGRTTYRAVFGRTDLAGFEAELRENARAWLERVNALLPCPMAPEYSLEVVREDAYWTNWIDGSVETGVRLRVNTHARTEYVIGSSLVLAAHEIAGHALHVAMLRAEAQAGQLPGCALNLTVHSCEAFHMEGLAQCVLHLAPSGVVPDDVLLIDRHNAFRNEVVNAAQIRMERGGRIDEVLDWAGRTCPLIAPLSIASDLRDRSRQPIYRGYVHVYAPARRLFVQAARLAEAPRRDFFARAYRSLMTPTELALLLATCQGSGSGPKTQT